MIEFSSCVSSNLNLVQIPGSPRSRLKPMEIDSMSASDDETDASDSFLPAELFPLIADVMVDSKMKGTLVELLCANKQVHALCLPSLMRSIELLEEDEFNGERLAAFSVDGLKSGKFSHVKSLNKFLDTTFDWAAHLSTLAAICKSATNMEILHWIAPVDDDTLSRTLWFMSLAGTRAPPVNKEINFSSDLAFLPQELIALELLDLPVTLTAVILTVEGTEREFSYLFSALDCLPRLEGFLLSITADRRSKRAILGFPKLLSRLLSVYILWPEQAQLLEAAANTPIDEVEVQKGDDAGDTRLLWPTLQRLQNLAKVVLTGYKTSDLRGLASTPGFSGLVVCGTWKKRVNEKFPSSRTCISNSGTAGRSRTKIRRKLISGCLCLSQMFFTIKDSRLDSTVYERCMSDNQP